MRGHYGRWFAVGVLIAAVVAGAVAAVRAARQACEAADLDSIARTDTERPVASRPAGSSSAA